MHTPIEISHESRPLTFTVDAVNERGETVPTAIAAEHPLTLYLDKRELVTLMTLGAAPEHLAIGYLRNQRILRSVAELAAVQVDWDDHVADAARHRHHAVGASRPPGRSRRPARSADRDDGLRPGHRIRRPDG
jgi:formate dehydrogenase assembly factor FdhD